MVARGQLELRESELRVSVGRDARRQRHRRAGVATVVAPCTSDASTYGGSAYAQLASAVTTSIASSYSMALRRDGAAVGRAAGGERDNVVHGGMLRRRAPQHRAAPHI